ncbi:MAG: sulfotransferase domain-containing protein [Bacteroidota bacterium]
MNTNIKANIFIIGASKCGTTSLWHMLNLNPNVFMSNPKEPWFFSFSNYIDRLSWYESLFEKVNDEKIIGEASPIYSETTLIPEIPQRIFNYNPSAKIIYIVREPISRLKSVWRQTLSSGHWYKKKYLERSDIDVPLMPKKFMQAIFEYPLFLEACKYWTHLDNYRKYFDDKNILLLFFEDLKENPQQVYNQICNFLEIEPQTDRNTFRRQNASEGKTMEKGWVVSLKRNQTIYYLLKKISNAGRIRVPHKTINYDVKISKNIENKINEVLKIEKEKILTYGQKPLNFWDK